MKATKIFMMAALALTFAACSNNDDNDFAQQPTEQPANDEITITATVSSDDATTRALSIDGDNIASTWETTDEFAILYNNGTEDTKSIATVDKIDGTTVTITFTIPASLANNTACTIVYPASAANTANTGADVAAALATQDGTIGNCPEVRVGTATINKDNHSLSSVTKLEAQNAIFKFTLSGQSIDATHPLVIKKGENEVVTTVTPTSSTTSVYVAMPPAASSTYRFIVNTDDNKYIKSGTAAITAGKYYQTTLDLSTARYPLALSSATVDDLGSVIGADGKIYLNITAATGASPATTAVAMIAYKSETAGESLAIQLNASPESKNWNDAKTYASGLTAVPGGTWRLPSKADWQNMFVGCAKSGDAGAGNTMIPIAGFKEKIGATGITWKSTGYWSSTGGGSKAWRVQVYLSGSYANANFAEGGTSYPCCVLGCLAF